MAISATTEWDVRTTGDDTAGGGFNTASSGTDYSQQDAPQVTYTDLVIGSTNTQLTSAANTFTSAHVGNVINVTGGTGFTVGRYQVVSVAGSIATMDRAVGTASSTGGAGKLGGALLTLTRAAAVAVVGNTVHVKAGTYTVSSGTTINSSLIGVDYPDQGGAAGVISTVGYQTTHFDNGTKPLLTTATNNLWIIGIDSGGSNLHARFVNLRFTNTATTKAGCFLANQFTGGLHLINCTVDGFATGVNGDNGGAHNSFGTVYLFGTEIKNSTAQGIINFGGIVVLSSNIHNNASDGMQQNGSNGLIRLDRSILASNSRGLAVTGGNPPLQISSSTIASNTGDGVSTSGSLINPSSLVNTILYGNGGWGVNLTTKSICSWNRSNAFGANTSGNLHNVTYAAAGDVTLTANPFTNSAGGDYSLNSTAGGGAACKGAGYQWS